MSGISFFAFAFISAAKRRSEMVDKLEEHKFVMTSALPLHGGASRAGAAQVFTPRTSGTVEGGKLTAPTPEKPIVEFK